MNEFHKALEYINERFYKPNHLAIKNVIEETQNAEYGAGIFRLNSKSIRFRVAKITPTKIGQFVAFWEKDDKNKNGAFSLEKGMDLLVINAFTDGKRVGQFVFPKEVLVEHNILKTATTKGKMGMRVYPSWDTPTSKQAIATQKWQLPYFVNLEDTNSFVTQKLLELYVNKSKDF